MRICLENEYLRDKNISHKFDEKFEGSVKSVDCVTLVRLTARSLHLECINFKWLAFKVKTTNNQGKQTGCSVSEFCYEDKVPEPPNPAWGPVPFEGVSPCLIDQSN